MPAVMFLPTEETFIEKRQVKFRHF